MAARNGTSLAIALAISAGWAGASASARAEGCARGDFEAVVGEAAAALRSLTQKNKPVFQARLRQLKEKRGWSHDQFLKEASPLVQDETIARYDEQSSEFLAMIESMGASAPASDASCKALGEVRAHMRSLVEVQQAKWTYMFGKVDQELGK